MVVCNFTPVVRQNYRLGVPVAGAWQEILNTDSGHYGGSNIGNLGRRMTEAHATHGHPQSLVLTLPPLATIVLAPDASQGH
jgi:1,4-alpha-glucan branching enzyme